MFMYTVSNVNIDYMIQKVLVLSHLRFGVRYRRNFPGICLSLRGHRPIGTADPFVLIVFGGGGVYLDQSWVSYS